MLYEFSLQLHPKMDPTLSTLMSLEASVAMLRELDPESRLERIAPGLGGWVFQEFIAVWYPKHPG